MVGCSCSHDAKFEGLSVAYKRALWAVIAINGIMFLVEMSAGLLAYWIYQGAGNLSPSALFYTTKRHTSKGWN